MSSRIRVRDVIYSRQIAERINDIDARLKTVACIALLALGISVLSMILQLAGICGG